MKRSIQFEQEGDYIIQFGLQYKNSCLRVIQSLTQVYKLCLQSCQGCMDSSQKLLNNLQKFHDHVLMEERAIHELYESIRNEFTKLPEDI